MALYLYKATAMETQKKIRGEVQAENELMVRQLLISRNLYPEVIQKKNLLNREIKLFESHIPLSEISFFCKQLQALIQAGISISKALALCSIQTSNKLMKQYVKRVYEEVDGGKMLSEAMREEKIFPILLVSLVACGERTGKLAEVLKRAGIYFDSQLKTRRQIKKALTYPLFVMGLVIVVLAIMMTKVVPVYVSLLEDTGGQMPLPTQIVIAINEFGVNYHLQLLLFLVALLILGIAANRVPFIKDQWEQIELKLPIIGKMVKQRMVVNFSSTMFLLIDSGINLLQALEMTVEVMNHSVAAREIEGAMESLSQGNRLGGALENSNLFPPILVSMISIGEESGALGELLEKSSVYFNDEMNSTIDTVMTLIEPVMIVIVALIIGGVMAAIVLPTFSAATAAI